MCGLFLSVDPAAYEAETRPIRLHGHVTSVRLEAVFWTILEEIAAREDITLARFVTTLHDEILDKHGEVPNFASLLRVTCLQYLRHADRHAAEIAARRARPGMGPDNTEIAAVLS
jgi:predicted DNA-binding ribbon-helix-helix protein